MLFVSLFCCWRLHCRPWKYNIKLEQHYLEVDESGELTKRYTQTKEEEEISATDKPVVFKTVTLDDPAAVERGTEDEAAALPPGTTERPKAEVESQDCFKV